ncbi:YitT family protein [Paenibacillus sp. GCM10027626]|uniref:YitT family protein n=1 Tax=Paenibacillus sp. GCM10027626 TaxID=3273411 RepID=UPI00363DCB87
MRLSNVPYPERVEQGKGKLRQGMKAELLLVVFGAVLASAGIELFLVPHQLVVGGVTGISMIVAYELEWRLGFILLLLNIPLCGFIIWRTVEERSQQWLMLTGMTVFGFATVLLHPVPGLTDDRLPAAVVGGAALGIGVGLVVRGGGLLDAAIRLVMKDEGKGRRYQWTLPVLASVLVIAAAWPLYEQEQVLHSALAVGIMLLALHRIVTGSNLERVIRIETLHGRVVNEAIKAVAGREANPSRLKNNHDYEALALTVSRLEVSRIVAAVKEADPKATVYIERERIGNY